MGFRTFNEFRSHFPAGFVGEPMPNGTLMLDAGEGHRYRVEFFHDCVFDTVRREDVHTWLHMVTLYERDGSSRVLAFPKTEDGRRFHEQALDEAVRVVYAHAFAAREERRAREVAEAAAAQAHADPAADPDVPPTESPDTKPAGLLGRVFGGR